MRGGGAINVLLHWAPPLPKPIHSGGSVSWRRMTIDSFDWKQDFSQKIKITNFSRRFSSRTLKNNFISSVLIRKLQGFLNPIWYGGGTYTYLLVTFGFFFWFFQRNFHQNFIFSIGYIWLISRFLRPPLVGGAKDKHFLFISNLMPNKFR